LLAYCTYTAFVRLTCLLHETCNERISETVKVDVSKDTAEMQETTVSAPIDVRETTEMDYVLNLDDSDALSPASYEQLVAEDVPTEVTSTATLPEAVDVLDHSVQQDFPVEEAAASLETAAPKEPETEESLTAKLFHDDEELPVSEELFQPENTSDIKPLHELHADIPESLAETSTELTCAVSLDTLEAAEEISQKSAVEETVLPAVQTEVKMETAVEQPLKQASVVEEIQPEDFVEPQESETVETEECAAELALQQPASPEVEEAESFISLPKEAVTTELESAKPEVSASLDVIQPTKVEETLTVPSADVQKAAEATRVEIKVPKPKPEVKEDVSVSLAMQPKSEDFSAEESLKISSRASVDESVSIESKKPESPMEEASLTLRSPTEDEESTLLSLRQPQEEEETDLTLNLKKPEAGMMAVTALACMPISSVDQYVLVTIKKQLYGCRL